MMVSPQNFSNKYAQHKSDFETKKEKRRDIIKMSRGFLPTISRSGNKGSLPVSTRSNSNSIKQDDAAAASGGGGGGFIRRRLSSSSINATPAAAAAGEGGKWSFPCRSKSSLSLSLSSLGESIRNWWVWSWTWILSRKPIFASDLEMNEHETKLLASRDRGSWKHVFYRMRSEIRRISTNYGHDYVSLPQTTAAYTKQ